MKNLVFQKIGRKSPDTSDKGYPAQHHAERDFSLPPLDYRAYFALQISTIAQFSEPVEVSLRRQLLVRILIVLPLCEHIIDQPDGQQVEIGYADTELHTAQHEERGGHYPLTFARFFLASTSVWTFRPHSSISWGRIW